MERGLVGRDGDSLKVLVIDVLKVNRLWKCYIGCKLFIYMHLDINIDTIYRTIPTLPCGLVAEITLRAVSTLRIVQIHTGCAFRAWGRVSITFGAITMAWCAVSPIFKVSIRARVKTFIIHPIHTSITLPTNVQIILVTLQALILSALFTCMGTTNLCISWGTCSQACAAVTKQKGFIHPSSGTRGAIGVDFRTFGTV